MIHVHPFHHQALLVAAHCAGFGTILSKIDMMHHVDARKPLYSAYTTGACSWDVTVKQKH